jgi:hypothetical protein
MQKACMSMKAILRAVDELHGDAMISDATWQTLAKQLDERQLIELPIIVGQYQTVAMQRVPPVAFLRRQPIGAQWQDGHSSAQSRQNTEDGLWERCAQAQSAFR